MIPKIIHYCWFGKNPKPKLAKKCIKSWKKYCPDYEIIEWNEENFDISAAPLYVQQAYEARKWAFVTDYVRLYAMVNYGGIYMDTDVEVIKSLDAFLHHQAFSGFEDDIHIPTGIMACQKGFPLFQDFLYFYDKVSFLNPDGSANCTTNVVIMTELCLKHGLVQNGKYQIVNGFTLYPKDVFCPISYTTGKLEKTMNTVTIHWFAGSWQTQEQAKAHKRNVNQVKRKNLIHNISHFPNRALMAILGTKHYEMLKSRLKK